MSVIDHTKKLTLKKPTKERMQPTDDKRHRMNFMMQKLQI